MLDSIEIGPKQSGSDFREPHTYGTLPVGKIEDSSDLQLTHDVSYVVTSVDGTVILQHQDLVGAALHYFSEKDLVVFLEDAFLLLHIVD